MVKHAHALAVDWAGGDATGVAVRLLAILAVCLPVVGSLMVLVRLVKTVLAQILDSFASCLIPEIARLGRTLTQWREMFLAYFATGGANNGGTEAINGLSEPHRRVARGFRNRDNYRLRMLLIGGAFTDPRLA